MLVPTPPSVAGRTDIINELTMPKDGTKRQHYVPQFLLRRFSDDGSHISLLLLSSGRRVDHAKIQGQCYEDYFYGKDQVTEKSFSAQEGIVAKTLGDLSEQHLELLPLDALNRLRLFAHYQKARTLGSAEGLNAMASALVRTAIRSTPSAETSEGDPDSVRLVGAQHRALWAAAGMTPVLQDLEVKFLVTERVPGFMISDHPVVSYNQYAEHHPDFQHCLGIMGLSVRGLQMFLPLSPSVTLAIFDPGTYQYGSDSRRVCRAGPQDVTVLNQMQSVHALQCLYFQPNRVNEHTLANVLSQRQQHSSVYRRDTIEVRNDSGSGGQIVAVAGGEVRLGGKLSFVRIRDQRRYWGYDRAISPVRSPELYEATILHRANLDAELIQRRENAATSDNPIPLEPDAVG
jgi:hypothetical protein